MSVLLLATIGGLVSFVSTSAGALLGAPAGGGAGKTRWNLSIDFALGLMVAAASFSLILPATRNAGASGHTVAAVLLAAAAGMVFVYLLKAQVERLESRSKFSTSHLILASVLMLHNFPEGLASGSALAGLETHAALPILGGISLQNLPEGALMVLCLRTLGWSPRNALLGGFASGAVELIGGVLAGVVLQTVQGVLPLLLGFAGGSMMASVLIEILQDPATASVRVSSRQFAAGFAVLLAVQYGTALIS